MPKTNLEVSLIGQDSNVFNLIGLVRDALRKAGHPDLAKEFRDKALQCGDYDAVLMLIQEYVEII